MALRAVGVVVSVLAVAGGWVGWNRAFRPGPARAVAHVTPAPLEALSSPTVAARVDHAPRDESAAPESPAVGQDVPAGFYSAILTDLEEGRLEQAEKLLDGLSDRQRNNPDYWFSTGCLHYKLRSFDRAVEAHMRAIAMRPDFSAAYAGLGDVYSFRNEHNKALEVYRKALKINPRESRAYCGEGYVYGKLGQVERALAVFEQGIAINPEDPELLCRKGLMLGAVGRYGDAEKAFAAALRINDKRVDTYLYIGEIHLRQGRIDAIDTYQKALAIQPDSAIAYCKLGVAFYRAGDAAAAEAAWIKADRFGRDGQWGRAARGYLKNPSQAVTVQ